MEDELTKEDWAGPYVAVHDPMVTFYEASKRWRVRIDWVRWDGPDANDGRIVAVRDSYQEAMEAAVELLEGVVNGAQR